MKQKVTGKWSSARAEKPLPSIGKMAVNAAKAGAVLSGRALRGEKVKASAEEVARRERICRDECAPPNGWYRASDDRCSHNECGCRLKWKRLMEVWHCPVGKW